MSSYTKNTINPDTHAFERANWLDNYFGQHNYGVRFPSTGIIYRADEYEWELDIALNATRAVKHKGGTVTREMAKRKDVTVVVNSLDVDLSDPSNADAKKIIEEQIIPNLAKKQILVTVIHKPTNDAASFVCSVVNVRQYAEKLVAQRDDKNLDHYCLVQHDGDTVTVTTL